MRERTRPVGQTTNEERRKRKAIERWDDDGGALAAGSVQGPKKRASEKTSASRPAPSGPARGGPATDPKVARPPRVATATG